VKPTWRPNLKKHIGYKKSNPVLGQTEVFMTCEAKAKDGDGVEVLGHKVAFHVVNELFKGKFVHS